MEGKAPIAGAVIASLGSALSWLCCLPLAASLLGAGTAATAAVAAPVRPYLTGLSVLLLGFAFYVLYGPAARCEKGQCPTRSLRVQRIVLWAAAGLTVALLTLGYWASWVIYWTL